MRVKLIMSCLLLMLALEAVSEVSSVDPTINAENHSQYGYQVTVEVPNSEEPDFKRLHITFPRQLDNEFTYIYTSALYARDGERLLSYRPQNISPSSDRGEYYILVTQAVVECLSLVNVYHQDGDHGLHPPSREIAINLASFMGVNRECAGGNSAANYW